MPAAEQPGFVPTSQGQLLPPPGSETAEAAAPAG
jgi:hypothetical protein